MAKRSLLSRCPSYLEVVRGFVSPCIHLFGYDLIQATSPSTE